MKIVENNQKLILIMQKEISNNKEELKKYIKETILKLKRKYEKDISGFYEVNVYTNKKIGMIIELEKEDEITMFQDIIDLNIKVYQDADIFLEFEDLFILNNFDNIYTKNNKYYISIEKIDKTTLLKIIEFTKYIYGKKLEKLKSNLNLVVKNSNL